MLTNGLAVLLTLFLILHEPLALLVGSELVVYAFEWPAGLTDSVG